MGLVWKYRKYCTFTYSLQNPSNLTFMDQINQEKKKNLLINLLCFVLPLAVLGGWMIVVTSKPEHQEIERGSVYFIKSIWGAPAGITLITLGGVILLISILKFSRKGPSKPKPVTPAQTFHSLSSTILWCSVIPYAIVLGQYYLADVGVLSKRFQFTNMEDINLVFITFIFFFSILTLITWLVSRKRK
jgi:hypothetical protein